MPAWPKNRNRILLIEQTFRMEAILLTLEIQKAPVCSVLKFGR